MIRRLLAALALAVLGGQAAQAQSEIQRFTGIGDASSRTIIEGIGFTYDVEMSLGQMMREPVFGSRFRWLINVQNSQATIPAMGIGENTYEAVPLGALGSQAPSKVRIYNVKIEYQFSTSSGTLYYLSDAGDPAQGDGRTWSFNVPGSPDWGRMFYRSPLADPLHSRSFVSAEVAKKVVFDSVRLVTARVLDAEISFYDLHNWYMRGTDAPEAIATEKALEDIRNGIFRNFGYRVADVRAAFFTPSKALGTVWSNLDVLPSIMRTYLKGAKPRLAKLMDVPKELRTSADSSLYDAAVRRARATLKEARSHASAYRSPDKDPRRFRRGSKPEFGGSYAVREISGANWIVDTANGDAKVRKIGDDARLIGSSFYIHREKVEAVCKNNILAIALLDPVTEKPVHSVDLPCPVNGTSIKGVGFVDDESGGTGIRVSVPQSKTRRVKKTFTCRACGRKSKKRETLNRIDFADYLIKPDLSFAKGDTYTWTQPSFGCGLTLCRD